MSFWAPENLRSITGGSWAARPPERRGDLAGVSIDSRRIEPGQVFFAIRGERTDGHRYLAEVARAGAAIAIVSAEAVLPEGLEPSMGVLRVLDTRRALLRLAAAYRQTLERTRVIGVTGSNGKTTTKGLIHAVLSRAMRGSASPRSFNNDIGVPLTILAADRADRYLICEIGTNAPGEVAALARVVEPDIGVVTCIGREHLERLGNLETICAEESSQLDFLRPGGLGVVNADSPLLVQLARAKAAARGVPVLTFGVSTDADVRVTDIACDGAGLSFRVHGRGAYRLPLLGRHNAVNAGAAIAVGLRLGVAENEIAAGLESIRPAPMRLESRTIGAIRVINDAYNANPDSMRAALETLGGIEAPAGGRRIAILGDMLELGEHTESAHAEVVERLGTPAGPDLAILVGPNMRRAAGEGSARIAVFDGADGAGSGAIARLLCDGDVVLLKGSRRMGLERVVEALEERVREPLLTER